MIKELFLAIVIGAILGFGLTGGYLTFRQKNQTPKIATISQPTIIPTPTTTTVVTTVNNQEVVDKKITIISPEDNLLIFKDSLNIKGNTSKNSQIIINTSTQNFSGQSDQNGIFDIPITLDGGLNIIKISAIDSQGNQVDTEINVTFSTTKI